MYLHIFVVLLPSVLSQVDMELKPDVRFDEDNERFDVTALMDPGVYEQKQFRRNGESPNKYSYEDMNKTTQKILRMLEAKVGLPKYSTQKDPAVSQLLNMLRQVSRRAGSEEDIRQDDWAWHDDMQDREEQENYDKNLEQFRSPFRENRRNLIDYLHGEKSGPSSRRNNFYEGNPDKEVLLHHAVPIVMRVQGYLQAPRDVE